jgi:ribosomal protein S19
MTPKEVFDACQHAIEAGHLYMVLTIPRRTGRRSARVRVMPGVMGRSIGDVHNGRLLVDVKVADVMAALAKVMP